MNSNYILLNGFELGELTSLNGNDSNIFYVVCDSGVAVVFAIFSRVWIHSDKW